eukprot:7261083-Prymnesium_polylepis.1
MVIGRVYVADYVIAVTLDGLLCLDRGRGSAHASRASGSGVCAVRVCCTRPRAIAHVHGDVVASAAMDVR